MLHRVQTGLVADANKRLKGAAWGDGVEGIGI